MELACVAIAAGSELKANSVSNLPSGVPDIAPTMLHLLGIAPPPSMIGRVLDEALLAASTQEPGDLIPPQAETFESGDGTYAQTLGRVRYAGSTYLTGGWRLASETAVSGLDAAFHDPSPRRADLAGAAPTPLAGTTGLST